MTEAQGIQAGSPAHVPAGIGGGVGCRGGAGLRVLTGLLLSLAGAGWGPGVPGVSAAELIPAQLRIGIVQAAFAGVNRNDAEASFKAFLATVGRQRGYEIRPSVQIFEEASGFEGAVERRELDLAVIDSWNYVRQPFSEVLEPVFASVPREKVGRAYVMLTRVGSGLNALADLQGRKLVRLEMSATTMGGPWLETLLLAGNLGRPEGFFAGIEVTRKPTGAVLPVFFGTRDCCLVDTLSLDLMKELNPQVGAAMHVLASSPTVLDNVLCLAREGWSTPGLRQDTAEALGELQKSIAGKQILTLFKIAKFVPFEDRYLETVRAIRGTYDRLSKAPPH